MTSMMATHLEALVRTRHPLFDESEALDRLMECYGVRPIADLHNTETVIKDGSMSFVIATGSYYILLIRRHAVHMVVRDNVNIYTDSILRPSWKMAMEYGSDNTVYFNIKSASAATYLFYVRDNTVCFNKSLFRYSDSPLHRMLAVST